MQRIEHGEDVEPENYLELAVTQWLPRTADCAECRRALDALAVRLEERHGDRWLRDVLAAKPGAKLAAGLHALSEAVHANLADESEPALTKAVQAADLLRMAGTPAGRMRAEFEQTYALHRSVRSAAACLKKATALEHEAGTARYSWIHTQAVLEEGNCRSLLGDSGGAHNDLERALTLARAAGYRDLMLRAASILTEARTGAGNLLAAWEVGREGLAEYWTGAYSGMRGQQICLNLTKSADGLGLPQAAYVLETAAAAAVAGTPRRRTEAATRAYLAELAEKAGWPREAAREFDRAAGLFNQLPETGGNEYRIWAELYRAQAEIAAGAPDIALRSLEIIRPDAEHVDAAIIRIRFDEILGDLLRLDGRPADAETSYRRAIRWNERELLTLSGYLNRARFMLAAAKAYRGLAELLWSSGDTLGALRIWEWFRSAERPEPRDQPDLDRRLPSLRRESFLTFAELPGGLVAWLYDDRGVAGRRLDVRPEDLETVASRFLRECADRGSDTDTLQRDARQLYDWLIAPLAERLDPSRTLVIEPDGPVGTIPIQALMDPAFHYVGERFAITIAAGLADYQRRTVAGPVESGARALVVADPTLGREMAKAFPPLPGTMREGQAVAERFRGSVLLSGREATLPAVERHRARAEVFHFAGHGFSNAGNGGLLLSSGGDQNAGAGVLDGSAIAQQDWTRCRLAVLSACSAGTGEARGTVNPESLVRSLLWAGVARVVASRWNMDTQAGVPFIDQFYTSLISGEETPEALQHAAQRLRRDGATSHPFYWAGFQSFGAR
uniref:CHAT domain-containing protein n=1 Tax=Solibacter usitatus (strain Ellin6076) TaxID=234267 RepID=Q02DA1_SOLUE